MFIILVHACQDSVPPSPPPSFSFFLCGPYGRVRASCVFVCLPFLMLECVCCVYLFLGCASVGCFCMLACFISLVCVHRRQVRRCSLPRPPLLFVFFACCLLAFCARVMVLVFSVQTVLDNVHACIMLRLRILRPLFVAFWLIQLDWWPATPPPSAS